MIFGSFASCVKYPHLPGKILQTVVQTVDRKSWLEWISIKGNDMQRIFEFAIVETWSFSWISSSAWCDALLAAYQCFRSCHISQFWRCVHKYLAKWVPPFQIFNWPVLTLREGICKLGFIFQGKTSLQWLKPISQEEVIFWLMVIGDRNKLANLTRYDIRLLRHSSGHLFKINLNAMFYNLL